jgi:hypothetical protein
MTQAAITPVDSATQHRRSFFGDGMWIVLCIALAKLLLHYIYNNRYGYFRDEFDYLACAQHLAWGYVDQPPLLPFLVRISRNVLGESLRSVRFLPALSASAIVVLGAMIARELGGRRFALILTAICVLIAPIYLSDGSLLTTDSLEPLLWMGSVYFAILAIKRDEPRYWLWFGVVAGLGLEQKYSIAVLGFGIVVGLLFTNERRSFRSPWIWMGGLAAFLIFLPNLIWNYQHDWPFVQLMHNIKADGRDVQLSPLQYLSQQILLVHPLTAPIWIVGVLAFLFWPPLKRYRFLGWAYLVCLTVFIVLKGKNYYLAPIYPMLLGSGSVFIEYAIEKSRQRWLQPVSILILLAGGVWLIPLVVPVLPVEQFIRYMDSLPFKVPRSEHSHMTAVLPQYYADQFGWQEMVANVAHAWSQLDPAERRDCGIMAQDYGQAGAIDFFGPRYGLPPALSGHQTWFLWGPRGYSGHCLIVLDDRKERLERLFERVEYVGSSDNPYALERDVPVYICRGAKFGSLATLWPHLKKWR